MEHSHLSILVDIVQKSLYLFVWSFESIAFTADFNQYGPTFTKGRHKERAVYQVRERRGITSWCRHPIQYLIYCDSVVTTTILCNVSYGHSLLWFFPSPKICLFVKPVNFYSVCTWFPILPTYSPPPKLMLSRCCGKCMNRLLSRQQLLFFCVEKVVLRH